MTRLCLLLLLAVACGRAPTRDNALDPSLTPAPQLRVTVQDTLGSATLQWTPYSGQAPFLEYLILRVQSGLVAVDTLARITQPDSLTFTDSSLAADIAYEYAVSSVNTAGFEVTSERIAVRPLQLPGSRIVNVEFQSMEATAQITWTRYGGPRFAGYELRRSVGDEIRVTSHAAIDDTVFIDSRLHGATPYSYTVRVLTQDGDFTDSAPVAGGIHPFVAQWNLDTQGQLPPSESVRLYGRPDGGVAVLISVGIPQRRTGARKTVRLMVFGADGSLQEDRVLLEEAQIHNFSWETRHTSLVLLDDGGAQLGLADPDGFTHGIVSMTRDGALQQSEALLQLPPAPAEFAADARRVQGEIGLADRMGPWPSNFRDVSVFDSSGPIFAQSLGESGPMDSIQPMGGWRFMVNGADSNLSSRGNIRWGLAWGPWLHLDAAGEVSRNDENWNDIGVAAQVSTGDAAWVRLGGDSLTSVTLDVATQPDWRGDHVGFGGWLQLNRHVRTAGSEEMIFADSVRLEMPVFRPLTYDVRLWIDGDNPTAVVRSPDLWFYRESESLTPFASLAQVGDFTYHTVHNRAFVIDADGVGVETEAFESPVSETRAWFLEDSRFARAAVCLPVQNEVRWGFVLNSRWTIQTRIEQFLGDEGGLLYYPLSMDGSRDGRFYILDAGNARVVVLDEDGRYITQFGSKGSGPGQFDLGDGSKLNEGLDYGGSVAVDGDGFIYVADIRNRRIQKFAP